MDWEISRVDRGRVVRTMMDANITLFHAIILSDSTITFNGVRESHHHPDTPPDSVIFMLPSSIPPFNILLHKLLILIIYLQ